MGTLNWIHACWQCDGCGKDFVVDIDTAWKPPSDWDTTQIAEDAVRHGFVVPKKGESLLGMSSVQHDLMLCAACTTISDEIGNSDEYKPTRDEILEALGGL